jgi:hypothetical protein
MPLYNGGRIGSNNDPTSYLASGLWTGLEQCDAVRREIWPTGALVTDGLLIRLDAGDSDSYPGSGSAWYDLSGNDYHMSLKNSPSFFSSGNNKYFDLNGSNNHGICDGTVADSVSATVANLGVGGSNEKTVVCVAMVDNTIGSNNGGLFDLGDYNSNGRHYCLRLNNSYAAFRAQFWGTGDYNFSYDGTGIWTMYSVVYGSDKIGKTYGNNGALLGQSGSAIDLATAGSRPFEMGRYTNTVSEYYFGGKIAVYLVYNRGLTQSEVTQNFDALKGRYGF